MFRSIALAALVAAVPAAASAATTYGVTNFSSSADGRGLWTDTMVGRTDGTKVGRAFNHWSMSGATLVVDGDAATFQGTAINNGDAAISMDFRLDMQRDTSGTNPGYCQYGGAPFDCDKGNAGTGQGAFDGAKDWDFFELVSGSFVGKGAMAGIEYAVGDVTMGKHLPQIGVGANAFDKTDLGFSSWISWEKTAGNDVAAGVYSFLDSSTESANKHGDFNVDLVVAPLPAGLPLMLAGMGAFAAVRSRRKRA